MFESLLSKKFRWPQKGDRLLKPEADWNKSASLSNDPITRHVLQWDGSMRAGAVLVDHCVNNPSDRHQLIYAIFSNYRHGLEMAMKWVLERYGRHAALAEYEKNHNLWQLWMSCKEVILALSSNDKTIDIVQRVVKEFHDLDPTAEAFRYPQRKTGAPIPFPSLDVDLQNVKDVMEGVNNFFGGLDGELDANVGAMTDFSDEY